MIAVAALAFVVWRRGGAREELAAPVAEAPAEVKPPEPAPATVDAAAPAPVAAQLPDAAVAIAPPAPRRQPAPPQAAVAPAGDPFVDALRATTAEGARLNADYARARIPAPPQARTLIELRERGVPQAQLVDYVRASFPKGILVRAIALRWLGVGATPGKVIRGGTDPGSTVSPRRAAD